MKYYNQLYDKLEELPPIIKNFIKTLSKKINKALEYTKDKKIPKTNNLVELLFKVTFSGKIKRIQNIPLLEASRASLNHLTWIRVWNPILSYLGVFTSYPLSSSFHLKWISSLDW